VRLDTGDEWYSCGVGSAGVTRGTGGVEYIVATGVQVDDVLHWGLRVGDPAGRGGEGTDAVGGCGCARGGVCGTPLKVLNGAVSLCAGLGVEARSLEAAAAGCVFVATSSVGCGCRWCGCEPRPWRWASQGASPQKSRVASSAVRAGGKESVRLRRAQREAERPDRDSWGVVAEAEDEGDTSAGSRGHSVWCVDVLRRLVLAGEWWASEIEATSVSSARRPSSSTRTRSASSKAGTTETMASLHNESTFISGSQSAS